MIEVKNVSKKYRKVKALDDISFNIEEGKITCILGINGVGKSTILKSIAGLIKPDKGEILIDGESIKKYNLKSFRKNISIISQDLLLLDDSIFNNLTLGRNKISLQKVEDVCNNVGLLEYINGLEDGFNTNIGENGTKLSGGQKQRVASARAIITNPQLVLADEPTGALDSKSAKQLLESFEALNQKLNATILMVTHDSFTASYANRILFIKDGKIFNELTKGNDTRKQFFEKIIEVQTLLGGELGDVI